MLQLASYTKETTLDGGGLVRFGAVASNIELSTITREMITLWGTLEKEKNKIPPNIRASGETKG